MQQIRSALDQAVAGRERRAEFQEAARFHAGVGKIGREIIQGLFQTVAAGERDAHAAHGIRSGIFAGEIRSALVVQRDRTDAPQSHARARQEHVEDRQGAADLARLQIGLHLLGDEEAEAQDRTERALDIVER